jgi:hypothetical protein
MVTVQPDPSRTVLSSEFIATLARASNATETAPIENSVAHPGAALDFQEIAHADAIRQKGDRSLYWYFLGPTSSWKLLVFVVITSIAVCAEEMGGKFPKRNNPCETLLSTDILRHGRCFRACLARDGLLEQ